MIGLRNIAAAALFGLLVVAAAASLNGGEWCSEKGRACGPVTQVDPGYLLALTAVGIVGLLTVVLVANLAFELLRYRRSED